MLHPVNGLQICQKFGLAKIATFTLAGGTRPADIDWSNANGKELIMPTTIDVPLSVTVAQRFNPSRPNLFNAQPGFAILMLWALIMLSIGAAAHFGFHAAEYSAFELLAMS